MEILAKHRQHFKKIKKLYPYQEKALASILENNNTLSIVPTGGGKSLIFQLGALELEGITLVISPLVALMKEQVDELNDNNIPALALNGNIPFQEQRKILRELQKRKFKLIYLSPERLYNSLFRKAILHSKLKVSMIVIDEAHCISQWGGQFRPEYAQIKPFLKFLRLNYHKPTIFALTATLASQERKSIINEFEISIDSVFINRNIIRPELNHSFNRVNEEENKSQVLLEFLNYKTPKKTLVYLYSKSKCESYAVEFKKHGYSTAFFHSKVEGKDRGAIYNKFKSGEIDILFATTAFGMGINIPDIDAIVHLHIPNSIEEYYQQAGRGARDKLLCPTCSCLLIWSEINFDRRYKRILREKIIPKDVREVFELMGFKNNKEEVISKDYSEYNNTNSSNLPLFRFHFEKHNLIKSQGEVNGSPLNIRLFNNDSIWSKFIADLDGFDSFTFGSEVSGISIPDIIKHIFKLEMEGKIEYLPALQKSLFFKVNAGDVPNRIVRNITNEINCQVDLRLKQLLDLRNICESDEPIEMIKKALN